MTDWADLPNTFTDLTPQVDVHPAHHGDLATRTNEVRNYLRLRRTQDTAFLLLGSLTAGTPAPLERRFGDFIVLNGWLQSFEGVTHGLPLTNIAGIDSSDDWPKTSRVEAIVPVRVTRDSDNLVYEGWGMVSVFAGDGTLDLSVPSRDGTGAHTIDYVILDPIHYRRAGP